MLQAPGALVVPTFWAELCLQRIPTPTIIEEASLRKAALAEMPYASLPDAGTLLSSEWQSLTALSLVGCHLKRMASITCLKELELLDVTRKWYFVE